MHGNNIAAYLENAVANRQFNLFCTTRPNGQEAFNNKTEKLQFCGLYESGILSLRLQNSYTIVYFC